MKNPQYNGVCLTMVGRDGNLKNVPVAVAFVPKETQDNFSWFFANCAAAGVRFSDRPIFCDRGRQLVTRLGKLGFDMSLKFCSMHIYFDVVANFKSVESNIEDIKPHIYRLQAAQSKRETEGVLKDIRMLFPTPRALNGTGDIRQQHVDDYLRRIHPTISTQFGNYFLCSGRTVSAIGNLMEQLRPR